MTPYDHVIGGAVCGQAVQDFTHTATLRLTATGSTTILIRGRTGRRGDVLTVAREVVVR